MKLPKDRPTRQSQDGRGTYRTCCLQRRWFRTLHSIPEIVEEAATQSEATQQQDSIPAPREDRASITKYGSNRHEMTLPFNGLSPPYFFVAVRSFGEYPAERAEIRPYDQSDSQELFAKKPANTGDFPRSDFGERALPKC